MARDHGQENVGLVSKLVFRANLVPTTVQYVVSIFNYFAHFGTTWRHSKLLYLGSSRYDLSHLDAPCFYFQSWLPPASQPLAHGLVSSDADLLQEL